MRTPAALVAGVFTATLLVSSVPPSGAHGGGHPPEACFKGPCPDFRSVVPQHLGVHNAHQREVIRFTNGVANTGAGDARLRPEFPLGDPSDPQLAIQQILDASGAVVHEEVVSAFEYHPEHNHWHVADVAQYEIRHALDDGTGGAIGEIVENDAGVAQSVKTTFCLVDSYALDGHSPSTERGYWDCHGDHQGVSPGWVDQYHQSLPDQELDVTGAPAGVYYLVTVANPAGAFIEQDGSNNTAWRSFELVRKSRGNPKLSPIAHSACDAGLCGEVTTNR